MRCTPVVVFIVAQRFSRCPYTLLLIELPTPVAKPPAQNFRLLWPNLPLRTSDSCGQTSRSHYGSKVPAVTITVFKYRNKIGKIVVNMTSANKR